jgi:hypothetical protein
MGAWEHGRGGENQKPGIEVTAFATFVIPEISTACHGEAESEDGKS